MKTFPNRNYIIRFKKPLGEERAVDDLMSSMLSEPQGHPWGGWGVHFLLALRATKLQATRVGTASRSPYSVSWEFKIRFAQDAKAGMWQDNV